MTQRKNCKVGEIPKRKAGLSVETDKSRNIVSGSIGWSVSRFVSFHNLTKRKGAIKL